MHPKEFLSSPVLQEWLRPSFLDEKKLALLRQTFRAARPFPHLTLEQFFRPAKIRQVRQALQKERFIHKDADLFSFSQTQDLISSKDPTMRRFRLFLASDAFVSYLSSVTGLALKQGVLDMAGTLYEDTDHLLCHDDRLEGRALAYMAYLSTLRKEQGGELDLFESKRGTPTRVAKSIHPWEGSFTFFAVSKKSFHRVREVIDARRYAIGGWYHGH